jgi:DeoR/GlpR family transcriptional regulator of sugar metabolism
MLTSQRKHLILERLRQNGQIIAKDFSAELGLSEDTIRRDLRELSAEGLLQRVHGGALPASPATADFATRENLGNHNKKALGQKAALMIQHGQVIFMDGGTTNTQLVRHLPRELEATIVTHSPSIAVELVQHPNIEVVLIGGHLYKHSIVSVGAAAIESINRIQTDIYFMGVTAIHATHGLGTGNLEEAYVKRALMHNAAEIIVLSSSEKLGAVSPYKIAELNTISELIIDSNLEKKLQTALQKAGVKITKV